MTRHQSFQAIKASSESKIRVEKRNSDQHRDLLVLIGAYLKSNCFFETAHKLKSEAGSSLARFEAADNIDLMDIVTEYEDFYELKFGRKPKFTRRAVGAAEEVENRISETRGLGRTRTRPVSSTSNLPHICRNKLSRRVEDNFDVPAVLGSSSFALDRSQSTNENTDEKPEKEMLKPLPDFEGDSDMRALANSIRREIVVDLPGVLWDDVIGLEKPKQILQEALVLPMKYPHLFTGLLSPWRGALLFGPPGTGKTMLAKAVATQCNSTFFSISSSTITSKFRGDSEKLVRVLFELARYYAPSTIFFDEVDAILSSRGGKTPSSSNTGGACGINEHEGSRRMKTELFIQMDGLQQGNISREDEKQVFVLAATNLPWDLDQALLRRLEKRIFIAQPDEVTRLTIINTNLMKLPDCHMDRSISREFLKKLAVDTEGYSGSDLKLLVKEAAMKSVRRILQKLELGTHRPKMILTAEDFEETLLQVNPCTSLETVAAYKHWMDSHGSS